MTPETHNLAVTTHGRVLLRRAAGDPRGLIVGFHGYLENAAIQLARLETIPGAGAWTLLSIQGLNRVYRGRSHDVVAGWMTRENREDAIADNLAYVTSASKLVAPAPRRIVYAGFSQGGAMAFRAGTMIDGASAIVAVGSDVPPELLSDRSIHFPP